jgi:alanine racemase
VEAAIGTRPTFAQVDLDALEGNFRAIVAFLADGARRSSRSAPGVIAVVKANAYGHGATRVASALERAGARMLAVADVPEGMALRDAGIRVPILVFGALGIGPLDGVFTHDLTPTISTPSAASALETAAAARGMTLGCQLKVDTGMHRLGFRHDHLHQTLPMVLASRHLRVDALYTHFATADDPESELFALQRERFEAAEQTLRDLGLGQVIVHAANSAALLRDERVWYDMVRPGLLLYGVVPPPLATTLPLWPVMSIRSQVAAVKGLRAGEPVGYGATFVADAPRRIAVVPAGYADGLDTRLGNRGVVLVRGHRVPVIGSVCMDMMVVDVTGIDVEPGDDVVIVGGEEEERIDFREIASTIGCLPWELLCRVGSRIERVYK